MAENSEFKAQAYSKQQLAGHYRISQRVLKKWLDRVPDLGEYIGKTYTPAQVQKIINHLGAP